ncbi:MAG: glycine cleavage system aminomethyltransferase GcvT [bacterium]
MKTPLYEWHVANKARMVEFGGWEMPVYYTTVSDEHNCVRKNVGLFDLCHMGQISVSGDNALEFLQQIATNNISKITIGQVQYSPVCNDLGGIIDDVLVYRKSNSYLVIVNASNTQKDFEWFNAHKIRDVEISNVSKNILMLAVQGPSAEMCLQKIASIDLKEIKYYYFKMGEINGTKSLISRTGYTGEDGFEIYAECDTKIWEAILDAGREYAIKPIGLGARDTLRLEAAMPLYGHELDIDTNPLEAGLVYFVDSNKKEFIGKDAIERIKKEGIRKKLVAFRMLDRGIPRHGYKIVKNGKIAGKVTSGTMSPTLNEAIGLGYIGEEYSDLNTKIDIVIRDKGYEAIIIKKPFYKRKG